MIQFPIGNAEFGGRDDSVGSTSRRFSTTDFADNADAFLSVPIRAIRGLFWLPRLWTGRCADDRRALAPVVWESAAMEPPNQALDRTAMSAVFGVFADSWLAAALTAVGQLGRYAKQA